MNKKIFNFAFSGIASIVLWGALRMHSIKEVTYTVPICIDNKPTEKTLEQETVKVTLRGSIKSLKAIDRLPLTCHINGEQITNVSAVVLHENNFSLPLSVNLVALCPAILSVVPEKSA